MTLIDGVGNEVTQFFFVVLCGLIALFAWWSTGQRQNRYGTAVVVDRHARNVYRLLPQGTDGHHRTMVVIRMHGNETVSPVGPVGSIAHQSRIENSPEDSTAPAIAGTSEESISRQDSTESEVTVEEVLNEENETVADNPDNAQSAEMNNIVDVMDSEASVLRNRRLAFFTNSADRPMGISGNDRASISADGKNEEGEKESASKSKGDADISKDEDNGDKSDDEANNIRIRLKYLNDDMKFVEGKLKEPLGEFKRRHFRGELSARKLVRLIFNGQVLKPEGATLESCGLFDNCVVHCLVHQPKTPQQIAQVQQQLNPTAPTPSASVNSNLDSPLGMSAPMDFESQEDRDWDLGHLLFMLLASLLSVAWYIHIRFSGLFGMTASMAMLGLTFMYIVAVVCVYFPHFPGHGTTPQSAPETPEPATVN